MSGSPHRHWFALHRHPNWHGHCATSREHVAWYKSHSCFRWHFHLPYRHRHTETGR